MNKKQEYISRRDLLKKLIFILLALVLVVSLFAGCSGETKNDPEQGSTAAETYGGWEDVIPTWVTAAEDIGPHIVTASELNKHENGWYQNLDNGTDGVYFNLWTNDIPVDTSWTIRYEPTLPESLRIVRDGVLYTVDCRLLKCSTTGYFLVCDPWLLGELSPLQANDVLILQGDFVNYDNGWGIHFDTNYIKLKGVNGTKFYTEPPEEVLEVLQ